MRLNYAKLLITTFLAAAPTALASTTWYVNGVSGNDANNCLSSSTACKTIGHAISLASSGDSIKVAAATYTENLTIGFSLTITGSAASTTIIDGGGVNTVVTISNSSAHVTLSNVTIRKGLAPSGAGITNSGTLTITNSTLSGNLANGSPALGGGIANSGTLTITNSTLSGNVASNRLCNSLQHLCAGGGIYNHFGTLTINGSTLSGNNSANAGGILGYGGALTVNNSTISGNSATRFEGGAIETGVFNSRGTLKISNSTLSGNSAAGGAGGGIVSSSGTVILQNTIVANNTGGNCSGTMISNGYNLSSDNTCSFNNAGDLNDTDSKLGPLRNHGGPTQTQALLSGSPAIDAGNPHGCTNGSGHLLKTDQRGQPRPDKEDTGGCDMGAYEGQSD